MFKAIENLIDLHQAEPFRRPLGKSVVHIARAVLHEASVMKVSESDLAPFSDNAGMKISCTNSALKIGLETSLPAI